MEREDRVDMELKEVFASALVFGGGSEGRGGLALPMLGDDGGLRDGNLTRGLVSAVGVGGAEVKDVRAEDGSLRAPAAVSMSEGEGNGLEACICDTSCCDFVVSTSFFFATCVASTVPPSTLAFCLPTGVGVAESVLLSRNIWSDALTRQMNEKRRTGDSDVIVDDLFYHRLWFGPRKGSEELCDVARLLRGRPLRRHLFCSEGGLSAIRQSGNASDGYYR